jgi:hypothetical protein
MNLNEHTRQAFALAAMQDVPKIDYDDKIRSLLNMAALKAMPDKVRLVYNDPATKEYLQTFKGSVEVENKDFDYWEKRFSFATHVPIGRLPNNVLAEAKELLTRKCEQSLKLNALRKSLYDTAKSARTRKQLVALLPEFEKYLPEVTPGLDRSVPALANLVANFMAAGWPKDQKKPIKAKKAKEEATA